MPINTMEAAAAPELAPATALARDEPLAALSSALSMPLPTDAAMATRDDYEVVFTEDRLGLTLRCQAPEETQGAAPPQTIVKSTSDATRRVQEGDILVSVNGQSVLGLDFRDVRRLLKISSRPICLRFRKVAPSADAAPASEEHGGPQSRGSDVAISDIATASGSSVGSRASSDSGDEDCIKDLADADQNQVSGLVGFTLPTEPAGPEQDERDDDLESHQAVQSESFGDADSTRTTENSSVITDFYEAEYKLARHSSLFSAFLRKPFRRADGIDPRRIEMRSGAIPAAPRVCIAHDSPCKAALRIYWTEYPTSVTSHVQFSRDRAMKVWRNWPGRIRRSRENDRELTTMIFGLDFSKSYVVRVRFVFNNNRAPFQLSEWSTPSLPLVTNAEPTRFESLRAAYLRAARA